MLRKFHEAKERKQSVVTLWGSGKPRREFLHVEDLAEACIFLIQNFNPSKDQNALGQIYCNIGTGVDLPVSELAHIVKEIVGFQGEIAWDTTKPDGVYQKLLDITKIKNVGWEPKIVLNDGIMQVYEWYKYQIDTN
jgi:GDP-L-fucose synthase